MSKVNRTVLHSSVPTLNSFKDGGVVRTLNDVFVDSKFITYQYTGTVPFVVPPNSKPEDLGGVQSSTNPDGLWVSAFTDTLDTLDKYTKLGIPSTRQLGISTAEELVLALKKYETVAVNSGIDVTAHTVLPEWTSVVGAGGRFNMLTRDACLEVRPNSEHYLNVYVLGDAPNKSCVYFDGKLSTPRWYVGEHRTKVTAFIRSTKREGTAVLLDGTSSSTERALISGLELDITVSKFNIACEVVVDNTKFSNQAQPAYITSIRGSIVAGGSVSALTERYSTGTTKPSNEEIGGNVWYIEHQPVEVNHYTLVSVGRLSTYKLNLWDNHAALNDNQIQVHGNDNILYGANNPSPNSKYVQVLGARNTYIGSTYGTPRFDTPSIKVDRSVFLSNNGNNMPSVHSVHVSGKPLPVQGSSSSQGSTLFKKTFKDILYRDPVMFRCGCVCRMDSSSSTLNTAIKITHSGGTWYYDIGGQYKDAVLEFSVCIDSLRTVVTGTVNSTNVKTLSFGGVNPEGLLSIELVVWSGTSSKTGECVSSYLDLRLGSV